MTLDQAKDVLAQWNLSISKREGEYRVNIIGGSEPTAYYTRDLDDAIATGRAMGEREANTMRSFRAAFGAPQPVMAIVRSKVNGRWGYCPKGTLERILRLSDEGGYRSARAAIAAARADNFVPIGATFEIQPETQV